MEKENIEKYVEMLNSGIQEIKGDLDKIENVERLSDILKYYKGEDKVISFKELEEKIRNEKPELKIFTGWKSFDEHTRGFRPQQLVLLTAVTGSGKTSFAMDLTSKLADYNPVWFPFEESADELVRKFIERGLVVPHAFTPQVMIESQIEWIKVRILEAIKKHNSQVVIIDHLEYIVPEGFDEVKMTSKIMRQIKGVAKLMGVTIFLIAHLKKVRVDQQPNVEDIKGSTSITQQADTVIVLWRETKKEDGQVIITNNVNVSIQKNRRYGSCGNIKMIYHNGIFTEEEWKTDAQLKLDEF